jgi:hypothetical protein
MSRAAFNELILVHYLLDNFPIPPQGVEDSWSYIGGAVVMLPAIFINIPSSYASWKTRFKTEVRDHLVRIKRELHRSIISWLDNM